jgi:hypothetical protein
VLGWARSGAAAMAPVLGAAIWTVACFMVAFP